MPHYGIHDELMDDWEKEGTGDIVLSDEVDSYLIDRLEANDKTARRFDILGWWKIKEIYNIEYEASQTEMKFYKELEMEHEREKEEKRSSSLQSSGIKWSCDDIRDISAPFICFLFYLEFGCFYFGLILF
ncbi:hypothetical protein ACHQM5_011558 [Ranunculus cassubicifolius]